ncbi:MAG: ABC-type multidrug transport system, ATPase and permease component, partial [Pseudomonas sp.]|nr:ABC-type multidrug transport system, ATPase and permease component [Pseudomonas sp.]
RTVLVVAHRLATVAQFNRVIVLHDGKIIEDGPPRQLRSQGGAYESLWMAQTLADD